MGSLPRSQDVVDFIFARERGEAFNQADFDACMTAAVSKTVGRQTDAGIDIVSDGETSKISYATYVKDRYTGFDGDSPRNAPADLKMFPSFLERIANDGGTPQYARPMCVGEVRSKGQNELEKDIANLKAAMVEHGAARGFMNAASVAASCASGSAANHPREQNDRTSFQMSLMSCCRQPFLLSSSSTAASPCTVSHGMKARKERGHTRRRCTSHGATACSSSALGTQERERNKIV